MKTTPLITLLSILAASAAQAQTQPIENGGMLSEPRRREVLLKSKEPIELGSAPWRAEDHARSPLDQNGSGSKLLDAPKPRDRGDAPCADHGRKSFAALGGRSNFSAPFHMDEPDKSWRQAMSHPLMWTTSGLLAGVTAKQLVETDRCVNANKPACNPVFGKNRAAAYAVNIPLTAAMIWKVGKLKEKGQGTAAVVVIGLNLMFQEIVSYSANPRVLTCQAGRTPQCQ